MSRIFVEEYKIYQNKNNQDPNNEKPSFQYDDAPQLYKRIKGIYLPLIRFI